MIKSVGQAISTPVDVAKLREGGRARGPATATDAPVEGAGGKAPVSPAARMAAQGAPVDLDRVAAVKAAIASGNYPVDPERIAEKMIALDLPGRG